MPILQARIPAERVIDSKISCFRLALMRKPVAALFSALQP